MVIGGTSFIGPYVVQSLSGMGHDVTVFHRGEHEPKLPLEVKHVHSPAAGIPVTAFPTELLASAWDVVLHMFLIGERDAQACMQAFRGRARRAVAISSGDVYRAYGILIGTEPGPLETMPLTEESPLRTVLYPYRKSAKSSDDWIYHYDKIPAEKAVMNDPKLPGTVLRLPMVYGPGDGGRLQPYLKQMSGERVLLEEKQARGRFQHGYVEDVAHAITLAVNSENAAGRIYNVGASEVPATAEWARQIGELAGWQGEIVALPNDCLPEELRTPYNAEQDLVYDTSRIRKELGYREIVPLEEGLRRTIRHPV